MTIKADEMIEKKAQADKEAFEFYTNARLGMPAAMEQLGGAMGSYGPCTGGNTPAGPVVTDVHPQIGPISGGTMVVIMGNGFVKNLDVFIGNHQTDDVVVVNQNTIKCKTPAVKDAGKVGVRVTIGGGFSFELEDGFEYEKVEADPKAKSD